MFMNVSGCGEAGTERSGVRPGSPVAPAVLAILFFAFSLSALFCGPAPASASDPIILKVHPYLSTTELSNRFKPLADLISKSLERPVNIEISPNYSEHITETSSGYGGIAFLGPVPYVQMVERGGPRRLIARLEADGSPYFQGVIFTRKDSGIVTLQDLAGRSFAFGSPRSTMSHLVPRALIKRAGVDVDQLGSHRFVGNHENVALGVLIGDFDAGAAKEETYRAYAPRGLRAIAWTPKVSEHVFVAGDLMDEETYEKIRDLFLSLHESEEGRKAIKSIKRSVTAMVPATDADYDSLREILGRIDTEKAER